MGRHRDRDNGMPGYDSFLDIVANLVGILIILIMVLGVRAKEAWQERDPTSEEVAAIDSEPPLREPEAVPDPDLSLDRPSTAIEHKDATPLVLPDVETARQAADQIQQTVFQAHQDLQQLETQLETRQVYRSQLIDALKVANHQVAEYNAKLAAAESQGSDQSSRLALVQLELARVNDELARAVKTSKPEPIALTHRPAPMAKTVFGREEHYRLLGGRISYIPMSDVVDQLERELDNNRWKLEKSPQISEVFGPIGDYHVRYAMVRAEREIQTESGPMVRTVDALAGFELVPSHHQLGLDVDSAMHETSPFRQQLASFDPHEVAITFWTYPDSYRELRRLKETLWKQGYRVATRPMAADEPIGGSPNGTKSTAE